MMIIDKDLKQAYKEYLQVVYLYEEYITNSLNIYKFLFIDY